MKPLTKPAAGPHDAGVDLVRIAATLLVVLTHVNMNATGAFSPLWTAGNIINSIVRPCVPFFLMATGALLLPQVDNLHKLTLRFSRIVMLYVVWSLLTYVYFRARGYPVAFTIAGIEGFAFPLWYFKMLIIAYLFLPLMQIFYRDASRWMVVTACGVLFVLYLLLPTLDEINGTGYSGTYNFYIGQFNFGYIAYFLAGALCFSLPRARWHFPVATLAFAAATAATAGGTFWLSQSRGAPAAAFIRYLSPTLMFQAISGFIALRSAALWLPSAWIPRVQVVAGLTLGVYVTHIMVLELVQSKGHLSIYTFWIWLSAPATTLVVFGVAVGITYLLRWSKWTRILVT